MTDYPSIFQLISGGDRNAVGSLLDEAACVLHLRHEDADAWQESTPIRVAAKHGQ